MEKYNTLTALASLAAASSVMAVMATAANAQDAAYPNDRIDLIVGFAAGGFADTMGRVVGQELSEKWNVDVVVENRAGAGGNTAASQVAAAPADGYTVLVTTSAIAINQTLYKEPGFELSRLSPVAIPVFAPEGLAVHPSKPATLAEFLAWGKDREITFATAGVGSGSHIAAEYFFQIVAKTNAVHVPFRGGSLSVQAALGNQVDAVAATFGLAPQIADGGLTGLAVAGQSRAPTMPSVPTYAEAGYPFEAASWVGFFVPVETPQNVRGALNAAIAEIVADPDIKSKLEGLGYQIQNRSPDEASAYLGAEVVKWAEMVTAIGATAE